MALKNILLLFVSILLVTTMSSAQDQDDDFDVDLKITKPKPPKSPPPKPRSLKKQPQPKPKSPPLQRRPNIGFKLPPLPKPSLEEPYTSPIHDDFGDETPSLAVSKVASHQEDQKLKIPRGASGLIKGLLNNPAAPSSGSDHSSTHPKDGTHH